MPEEEQLRKLFVGGISFDTTDEAMNEYFARYGTITDCVVIKEQSGKSKGFGFVTFETEQEADECMKNRPHTINGRQVDVKRAVSREESSKPGAHAQVKKIFIGGLKPECTEDDLKEYFGQFGSIESCEIPCDRSNNKPRGFGFVTFDDYDPVDKIVAKRHHDFAGMHCEVKKALSRQEMEKAKNQSNRGGGKGGRSRGGGGGAMGGGGYGNGGGDYGGYGGFGAGYGGYDGYDYYGGQSNYGPMKNQFSQRGSGPYGGSYGTGNGYGSFSGAGRYGGGYGGYGGSW